MYGGTYMLSKPDLEVVYSDEGVATGVQSEGETAKAKFVVGDPSELSSTKLLCGAGSTMRLAVRTGYRLRQTARQHALHAFSGQAQLSRLCSQVTLMSTACDGALLQTTAGYFKDRCMKVGKVVRAIAILSHPIPGTDNAQSAQIILPQKQIGRKNDMYVFCCSYSHNVCARDKWIAFVSTTVETTNPEAELAPGAEPSAT